MPLANLPPRFSPIIEYFAVLEETLELTIDVIDPEGMPVKVSLVNGSQNKAVVAHNVLIWNATNDATSHFYLKATDACQAISYVNITTTLVACQCQNNGSCIPHPDKPRGSGFYECDCVPGFTGDNCDINIDDCQSYPCFRGMINAVLPMLFPCTNARDVLFSENSMNVVLLLYVQLKQIIRERHISLIPRPDVETIGKF